MGPSATSDLAGLQPEQSPAVGTKSAGKSRLPFSTTLLSLCLAFVFVRLPFVFTVPMSEAPDEYAHFWVARFMHDYWRLPSAHEVAAGTASAVYGSLPQLGYLPHLLIGLVTPSADFVLFSRFGSMLMGLVLLYAAYQLGRELFPRDRVLALALPVAVIFHPQMAFVHAYTNNDSTSSALASILLLLGVRCVKRGLNFPSTVAIGALAGWLALSKFSGLGVLPSMALLLVAAAILHRVGIAKALLHGVVCIFVAAGVSGWWFLRNLTEFNGDLLGTKTMYNTWATTFNRPKTYYLPASHIIKEIRWWRMMFFSFWGMFGYMNKYMWRPAYITYLIYLVVAAIGLIAGGSRWMIGKFRTGLAAITREQKAEAVIWTAMVSTVVINLAAMIWASTGNLGGPQGRYLFTSELPVLALYLAGLNAVSARFGRPLLYSFLVFNAVTCIGAWLWLFNLYGFHGHPI